VETGLVVLVGVVTGGILLHKVGFFDDLEDRLHHVLMILSQGNMQQVFTVDSCGIHVHVAIFDQLVERFKISVEDTVEQFLGFHCSCVRHCAFRFRFVFLIVIVVVVVVVFIVNYNFIVDQFDCRRWHETVKIAAERKELRRTWMTFELSYVQILVQSMQKIATRTDEFNQRVGTAGCADDGLLRISRLTFATNPSSCLGGFRRGFTRGVSREFTRGVSRGVPRA